MKFIGFNFTKFEVERMSNDLSGLKINTKIDTPKIELIDNSEQSNEKAIKVAFKYSINYEPGFAKIVLSGDVFISEKSDSAENIIKEWDKDKTLNKDFRVFLFNILLRKCNLKALQFEDDFNLPIHLPFPKITKENIKEESKE